MTELMCVADALVYWKIRVGLIQSSRSTRATVANDDTTTMALKHFQYQHTFLQAWPYVIALR
jgi:hypothetical protein